MAKEYLITIKCPHCKEEQRFVLMPPNTYSQRTSVVQCWNSKDQKGCKKQMTLNQAIQVWTDATDEQKKEHEKAVKNIEFPEDRMGGG